MLCLCRRGNQNLRQLQKATFEVHTDATGTKFVSKVCDELTKNHRENDEAEEGGVMYAIETEWRPVASFEKYLQHLQYCAKVMQTIIAEYRSLFLRYIDDISAIYRTYKRCVATIIRRDIGASLRYLADISFLLKKLYETGSIHTIPIRFWTKCSLKSCFVYADVVNKICRRGNQNLRQYRSCDILPQRYIVQRATELLRYIALARYRYSDISLSERCIITIYRSSEISLQRYIVEGVKTLCEALREVQRELFVQKNETISKIWTWDRYLTLSTNDSTKVKVMKLGNIKLWL